VRQTIEVQEVAAEVRYLVALPPAPGLAEMIAAAPETNFLAVGVDGLEDSPNLLHVGGGQGGPGGNPFIGGYIASIITPDWRIGIITVQDGLEGDRFTAFENGMRFFCGLCRPQYAPFYEYPFFLSLPATASEAEWRALADFMRDRLVGTVFVSLGAGGRTTYEQLADLGVEIIGEEPPPAGLESSWVASIRRDVGEAYLEYLPRLFDGETGLSDPLPQTLRDVNETLLPPGRQRLVEQTLSDMQAGFILTGDPP